VRYLTDAMMAEKDGRLYFEAKGDPENVAVFYANRDGGLTVSVSDEQAVDSYNTTFECTFYLSADQAQQLRDLLNVEFPKEKAPAVSDEGSKSSDDATP